MSLLSDTDTIHGVINALDSAIQNTEMFYDADLLAELIPTIRVWDARLETIKKALAAEAAEADPVDQAMFTKAASDANLKCWASISHIITEWQALDDMPTPETLDSVRSKIKKLQNLAGEAIEYAERLRLCICARKVPVAKDMAVNYPLYTQGSMLPMRLWPVVRPVDADDESCYLRDGWTTITKEAAQAAGMALPADDTKSEPAQSLRTKKAGTCTAVARGDRISFILDEDDEAMPYFVAVLEAIRNGTYMCWCGDVVDADGQERGGLIISTKPNG